MAMKFINTNTQIRPCIVSKARRALGLKGILKQNVNQKCSPDYWKKTINTICKIKGIIDLVQKQNAINRFDEFMNN
jgi:hypothetical protein